MRKENYELYFEDLPQEIKQEKKSFSKILTRLTIAMFISYVLIYMLEYIISSLSPVLMYNEWVVMSVNCIYSVSLMLLFWCFTIKLPSVKPPIIKEMTFWGFLKILCISISIMAIGSLVGNGLSELVGILADREVENYVSELITSINILQVIVFVVIIGPIVEELIFRKLLIDKLSRYGSAFSIIISAIIFGLFHGNFFQFFYAAGLGIILGYIYSIYGKLKYPIILHMIINFIGSVIPILIERISEESNKILQYLASAYSMAYAGAMVVGIIFLIKGLKETRACMTQGILVKPFKMLWLNFGVFLFIAFFVGIFSLNILL